jgi:hypothetical protein
VWRRRVGVEIVVPGSNARGVKITPLMEVNIIVVIAVSYLIIVFIKGANSGAA